MLNNEIRKQLFVKFFEEDANWYFFEPESINYIGETFHGNSIAEKVFNALMGGYKIMLHDFETEDKIGIVKFDNLEAMEALFAASNPSAMQRIILNHWNTSDASMWFQFVSFGDIIV